MESINGVISQPAMGLVVLAVTIALGYLFLSNSLSPKIAVFMGLVLAFLGKGGTLSLVGTGLAGIGISEVIGSYFDKTVLSSA